MVTRRNEDSEEGDWFHEVWRHRDEDVYPRLLGGSSGGQVFRIPYVAFSQLGAERVDPRWLHCGVLRFAPTADRHGFAFITSGLSNAWDDEQPNAAGVSGLGFELRLDNPTDEPWCKDVMLRLSALQLLVGAGRLPAGRLLEGDDVIIVGAQTFGGSTNMTALLASTIERVSLASGVFRILQLFAITDAEQRHASEHGEYALLSLLREKTAYPMNDVTRASVV